MRVFMAQELCLRGLFLHLIDRGFPLSVRDYMDLVKALRAGYGLHDRASLLQLCQTLWGYTEEEDRYLAFLFDQIAMPTAAEIARIMGEDEQASPSDQADDSSSGKKSERQKTTRRTTETSTQDEEEALAELAVSFVSPTETGLGLPQAQVAPLPGESFILSPKPLVPLRILIITLRRFRRTMRVGPKVELDIAATVAEQCRTGLLHAPVLIPARRNQAQLTMWEESRHEVRRLTYYLQNPETGGVDGRADQRAE